MGGFYGFSKEPFGVRDQIQNCSSTACMVGNMRYTTPEMHTLTHYFD